MNWMQERINTLVFESTKQVKKELRVVERILLEQDQGDPAATVSRAIDLLDLLFSHSDFSDFYQVAREVPVKLTDPEEKQYNPG